MTISALNTWRKVYLAEALLNSEFLGMTKGVPVSILKITLAGGATLWLMHDLAHGRWRVAVADAIALLGCLSRQPLLTLMGVAYAVAHWEEPPSPFIWSHRVPRDTS